MTASVSPSPQTAASTASWPASSASSSLCAPSCWTAPPAAPAPETTRASAAAAPRRSAATATCRATWTAASWMPAASRQTAWRSAWSAAAFASPPEGPSQRAEVGCRPGPGLCPLVPEAQEQLQNPPDAPCCLGFVV